MVLRRGEGDVSIATMQFFPCLKGKGLVLFLVRWTVLAAVVATLLFIATGMPGESHTAPLPSSGDKESQTAKRLRAHVTTLAMTIGERNVQRPEALDAAARYIEGEFSAAGLKCEPQTYRCRGLSVRNLAVEIRGTTQPDEIVLVGAHYDSVAGSPGANDNGSGVASLLELARLLSSRPQARTVVLVAFVNEEPPFFQGPDMGSLVYARAAKERGDRITAMLALETMGYFTDAPRSQRYPFPFNLVYPDTGNFIAFVGSVSSRRLVRRCVRSFRKHAQFPSEGAAIPEWIPGATWSDHWSFQKQGYPALMVTDTAPFRYQYYHSRFDTPDHLDYDCLARVTHGLAAVISELAGAGSGKGDT